MNAAMIASAWRTPLGATIDSAMARLFAGERAAVTDPRLGYACTTIAPLRDRPAPSRQARFLGAMGLVGLEVAGEALRKSGLGCGPRTGVFCGVGGLRVQWEDMMPAFAAQTDDGAAMWANGLRDLHPFWMLRHLSNNAHALASATLGLRGDGATFGGANAGTQAIASAIRALADGAIDAALVIAYDSLLDPETLVELSTRGTATRSSLAALVAPYAAGACGSVLGEAAAAIVLVREANAPRAWISARASAGAEAIATLARTAAALVADVELVDGAARAWPAHDLAEREAIAKLVGADRPLCAHASAMGALGAATGVVQAIALAEMLHTGTIAPIAGLAETTTGPLQPVTRATPTTARVALGLQLAAPGLAGAIRVEVMR